MDELIKIKNSSCARYEKLPLTRDSLQKEAFQQQLDALADLWQRIQTAYNCNDKKGLQELELLTTTALEQLGIGRRKESRSGTGTEILSGIHRSAR